MISRTNYHLAEFVKACIDFGAGCSVRLADVNKAYEQHRGKGSDALKSRAPHTGSSLTAGPAATELLSTTGTSTAWRWLLRIGALGRCKTDSSTVAPSL